MHAASASVATGYAGMQLPELDALSSCRGATASEKLTVDLQMTLHHSFDAEFTLGTHASGQAHAMAETGIPDEQPDRRRQRGRISRWHEQPILTLPHDIPAAGGVRRDDCAPRRTRFQQRLDCRVLYRREMLFDSLPFTLTTPFLT